MSLSILNSTKKVLGLPEDYTAFDTDVIMHINTVFLTLSQLGVISDAGFSINDAEPVWDDLLGTNKGLNAVQSYTFMRLRMIFDPPATSFHIAALERQIAELEFRLNVLVDTRPIPLGDLRYNTEVILDGGAP